MRAQPLILLPCLLLLAACEPSAGDIEAALKKSVAPASGLVGGLLGGDAKIEIRDVRKLGCDKASAAGYRCDVEWVSQAPIVGERKHLETLTLIEASDGWTIKH
jgi:hypothetical protein